MQVQAVVQAPPPPPRIGAHSHFVTVPPRYGGHLLGSGCFWGWTIWGSVGTMHNKDLHVWLTLF